jgi:hypothetical protein
MKMFEVFFPCRIENADGSDPRRVDSSVQVEAADYGDAGRKISAALQRMVDKPLCDQCSRAAEHRPASEHVFSDSRRGQLKISIEGAQGSGKTTALGIMGAALAKSGFVVEEIDPETETLLVTQKPGVHEARVAIQAMPPAISGSNGHQTTSMVMRKLMQDFVLSDSDVWALLLEYNQRCQPPWSEEELREKLKNARRARF